MEFVTVSEPARVKAIALREAEGSADAVLRVGVQGGGCSGFQYLLEYDERRDDDHVLELDGLTVVIDRSRRRSWRARCWSTTAGSEARGSSSAIRRSRRAAAAAAPSRSTRKRSRRWVSPPRRALRAARISCAHLITS